MGEAAVDAIELKSAFELFNQHSTQLEQSYRELQLRVERLTAQLVEAQSARLDELIEKERLSQRLALLLDSLPGAIIVIDGDGVIQEQNGEALTLLNEPLHGCLWAEVVRREVREGGSEDGNIQLRDGRWFSLSRRPLNDEPGEILLLSDITESRQISALRQRRERLTSIGEMTAEFAHEVRTPLASAMLYVSQLESPSERDRRIVEKVSERLNDLGRMVNDMLGFAAGGRRADDAVDVRTLLDSVAQTLSGQLHNDTAVVYLLNGTAVSRCGEDTIRFAANADALKGALINLVMNAEQAGAKDIQVGAWRDDDAVYFTVTDDGPGIADDVLPRLFEPFFTTRPQGTGLGLAVVRDVAKAHGGDVVASSLSRGARFTLRLPLVQPAGSGDDDD